MSPSAPPPPPPPAGPEPLFPQASGSGSARSPAAGRRRSSGPEGLRPSGPGRAGRQPKRSADPVQANDALATLVRWGRNWLRREQAVGIDPDANLHVDPLVETGRQLRMAREAHGLSLRQLAQTTRISTAVLEALEKGWRERLPEPTYLRPILILLERRLDLRSGSLEGALPPRSGRPLDPRQDRSARSLLVPSIELLGSWQGGLVYALLCATLVYGLNRQQQHLASQGLLTLRPIPALPPQKSATTEQATQSDRILGAYPDLQPLEQARRGQALHLLQQQSRRPAAAVPRPASGGASPMPGGSRGPLPAGGGAAVGTPEIDSPTPTNSPSGNLRNAPGAASLSTPANATAGRD